MNNERIRGEPRLRWLPTGKPSLPRSTTRHNRSRILPSGAGNFFLWPLRRCCRPSCLGRTTARNRPANLDFAIAYRLLSRRIISFTTPPRLAGWVKVIHGANDDIFSLVGVSVASVQVSLVHSFNIPADAAAFVNGVQVSRRYRLQANDTVEFLRQEGRKGVGDQVWTEMEFRQFFKITSEDFQAWTAQGLKVKRCLDGSVRITESAVDEFFRAKVIGPPLPPDIPNEVSTEEAAQILGASKDTVLKFRAAGLLKFRNAAPPGSSRPTYRFLLESVMKLRTSYDIDEPTPELAREPQRRAAKGKGKYKYIDYD